jgi:uncharacterized membrane protein YgcG
MQRIWNFIARLFRPASSGVVPDKSTHKVTSIPKVANDPSTDTDTTLITMAMLGAMSDSAASRSSHEVTGSDSGGDDSDSSSSCCGGGGCDGGGGD